MSLGQMANKFSMDIDELHELLISKLSEDMYNVVKGKNIWINEEGVAILECAIQIPELVPKYYKAMKVGNCHNPKWIKCFIKENDLGRVQVLIKPSLIGKIPDRKEIRIEAITDRDGTTYRHVSGIRTF